MGLNKILVPLDGSALAEMAVPYATKAADPWARIHLLSVVDSNCLSEMAMHDIARMNIDQLDRAIYASTAASESESIEVYARQKYLKLLVRKLDEQGFRATAQLSLGYAASAITDIARDGFEVIVMSTHGRTGLRKILLGSVMEDVLRNSPCPVLVVPSQIAQQVPASSAGAR